MEKFPYRQIHMDFHTSERIEGVGEKFDPEEFAAVLKKARVDSVTCFARCHHGWLYYESEQHPELIHPGLVKSNLLTEQIKACHDVGIRVPIYTTVQWDGRMAAAHPEYCVITAEGALDGYNPYNPGFYTFLCVNSPYRDFLKDHLKEILTKLPGDGIFLDIVLERDCSCRFCLEGMNKLGVDPGIKKERLLFAHKTIVEFKRDISAFIRSYNKNCTIFFNGSHIGPHTRDSLDSCTHLEVESLPSGGWGYTHFPLVSRFTRGLGKSFCGMTGKFHTYWGDFHSFKNRAALEYECFNMLAMGGGCSIGDQLSPGGRIEPAVYDLIGRVYDSVEKKEPWCREVESVAEAGVFSLEEWEREDVPVPMAGALRMLEELAVQFDVIDTKSDFLRYKLLVLPDRIPVDDGFKNKLNLFLEQGGKILASYKSGLLPSGEFALERFGVKNIREDDLDASGVHTSGRDYFTNDYCDFVVPRGEIGRELPETEHSMYIRGLGVESIDENTRILAMIRPPHFYRTRKHFCSHQQTPSSGRESRPAITLREGVLYFSHPVFTIYRKKGPIWVKKMVLNGIRMLIDPIIFHDGPSTLRISVNSQKKENRWVIHLLHYIPEKRSEQIEIIEDVIPLYNLRMTLGTDNGPSVIRTVPSGEKIGFTFKNGRAEFTVPEINGHSMIEVQF